MTLRFALRFSNRSRLWCCFCCFRRLLGLPDTPDVGFVQCVRTTILRQEIKQMAAKRWCRLWKLLDLILIGYRLSHKPRTKRSRIKVERAPSWCHSGAQKQDSMRLVGQTPASYDMVSKALVLSEGRTWSYSSTSTTCVGQRQMQQTLSLSAIALSKSRYFGRWLGLWLLLSNKLWL